MLDVVGDFNLYYANYEATYSNTFWNDYKSLFFLDFYNKLQNVEGNYKEILRLRNLALNGKRTRHNKDEVKSGMKLLTKKQMAIMKKRSRKNMTKLQDFTQKQIDQEYAQFLKEKKVQKGV